MILYRFLSVVVVILVLFLSAVFPPDLRPAHAASGSVALPEERLLIDPIFARPGSAYLAIGFIDRTRYLLALDVDFAAGQVSGLAHILFVNTTKQPLSTVVFRLYPNRPRFSVADGIFTRRMSIDTVTVDGNAASSQVSDPFETVLTISLAAPIPPAGKAVIEIGYQIALPHTPDYMDLWDPFPLLAVYDEGGWRTDIDTKNKGLDYVYSESALYAIKLRVSTDVDFRSVGKVKDKQVTGTLQTYTVITGPVREFSGILTSKKWGVIVGQGGPTSIQINIYYLGSALAAGQIEQAVIDSMNFYDGTFDDYPYAQLTVIVRDLPSDGQEFPSFIYCNGAANHDSTFRKFIAVHETAHQWFYGLAGVDNFRHAWLNDSLAQIAGYIFYKNVYNSAKAENEYWKQILVWAGRAQGKPHLIDAPASSYKDANEYMAVTYGTGAVFFREVAAKIGDDALIDGLKDYVHAVYLGIGTPQDLFDRLQARAKVDLSQLFCQRVGIECKT